MAAAKVRRQQRIRDLIAARTPSSHAELQTWLAREGLRVNQATLSRDLHDLGVAKAPEGYVLAVNGQGGAADDGQALARVLRSELLKADHAQHTVVLRTRPGKANAVAVEIDRAAAPGGAVPEALGTVAGDDTIIVVTRTAAEARSLSRRLTRLAGGAS